MEPADGLRGSKPTWAITPADIEYRDGEIQISDTFTLSEAPDFVVPGCFGAKLDDPEYPCLVTLFVRMRPGKSPHVRVELDPRVDRTEALIEFDDLWHGGDAALEPMGSIPELPVSGLTRDALANAAMPRERPFMREMFWHRESVRRLLPVKRAQRLSNHERAVMAAAFKQARSDPELSSKYAIRERVYAAMHDAFPDRWPRGDGRTPDYDRLRPHLAEMDRELG